MLIWILIQSVVNILLGVTMFIMWAKLKRPPQDDPRLSKGLQLLQSKIAVLEDLSDRTEVQVKQLNTLMDERTKQVKKTLLDSDNVIARVNQSISKSLEVAEIFQDKIPHEEIIERKNTVKYAQAAKMAHEGYAVEQIIAELGIPRSEAEFISKVNKDTLMFDEQSMPAWANSDELWSEERVEEYDSLKKVGNEFRKACREFEENQKRIDDEQEQINRATQQVVDAAKGVSNKIANSAEVIFNETEVVAKSISREVATKTESVAKNLSKDFVAKTEAMAKDLASKTESFTKDFFLKSHDFQQMEELNKERDVTHEPRTLAAAIREKEQQPKGVSDQLARMPLKDEKSVVKKVLFPRIDNEM